MSALVYGYDFDMWSSLMYYESNKVSRRKTKEKFIVPSWSRRTLLRTYLEGVTLKTT